MIYELRTYHVADGRMPDMQARFRDHLPPIFARHSMTVIGNWVMTSKDESEFFSYMLEFEGYVHRDLAWQSFGSDPDWHRIRAATNAGIEMLLSYDLFFLRENADIVPTVKQSNRPCHEIVLLQFPHGRADAANYAILNFIVPSLQSGGGELTGCFDFVSGTNLPKRLLMLDWRQSSYRFKNLEEQRHSIDADDERLAYESWHVVN